jgi:hypothetical protein
MMMRRLTIVVAVLLAACSSGLPKVEKRTFEGGPGQPIELQLVGSQRPIMFARGSELPQQISFQFLVANNSDEILTVKRIMVYQHGAAPIQLEFGQAGFDTAIDPGHDHTFTVNATAKQMRPARQGDEASVVIRADVALTNGDSYVYTFEVPISVAAQ